MHNMTLIGCDTDAILVCKPDQSPFTKIEEENLINELNSLFPETIRWEPDGVFSKVIVLAAKNYIMKDEKGKITYKGSSLKSATLEPTLKEFLKEIIDSLLNDKTDFVEIYHKFIKKANEITDIKPWCSKRTLSEVTYKSERENEAKVIRAIKGTDYTEGDRVFLYYDETNELVLVENFKGCYNKDVLWKKLYKTCSRFSSVLDESMFLNYSLKKNKKVLEDILNKS